MASKIVLKEFKKFMREKSAELPITYTDVDEYRQIKGAELIAMGISDAKGEPINPETNYIAPIGKKKVDHYKKMLKILESKGKDAVTQYINDVVDLALESFTPRTIGGLQLKHD